MEGLGITLNLLWGVALLLWGLHTVQTGLSRAFGVPLRGMLDRMLSRRIGGFAAGIAVTIVMQSSTATSLLVASLAGHGIIRGTGGLAAMLGADFGSALVTLLFVLGLVKFKVLVGVVGVLMYMAFKRDWVRDSGRALVGLALVLFALEIMADTTAPLRGAGIAQELFQMLSANHLLVFALGFALTWLSHSSLALVLLAGTLVGSGLIGLGVGLVFILGVNVGNSMPATVFTWHKSAAERRIPFANLCFRGFGALLFLPLVDQLAAFCTAISDDALTQVISGHMLYNIAIAVIFFPFLGGMDRLLGRLVPDKDSHGALPARPRHLDRRDLENPAVAIGNAVRDTLTLGMWVREVLGDLHRGASRLDRTQVEDVLVKEGVIDVFYTQLLAYLTELTSREMAVEESARAIEILGFVLQLEQAGDVVKHSMCPRTLRMIGAGVSLPDTDNKVLDDLYEDIDANVQLALEVLETNDLQKARTLLDRKIEIATTEQRTTTDHLSGLEARTRQVINASSYFLDTMSDLKRINSLLSTVAYPIVSRAGLLRHTRLREHPKTREKDPAKT